MNITLTVVNFNLVADVEIQDIKTNWEGLHDIQTEECFYKIEAYIYM